MVLIYVINIVNFGMSAHLTKVFLYVTILLFVCGLVGFALCSMMFMVSGNIFEAVLSTISLSFIAKADIGKMLITRITDKTIFSFEKHYIL